MKSLESRLSRIPLLRKSDNLSIREILAMTSVYELPSVQTLGRGEGRQPDRRGMCYIFLAGKRAIWLPAFDLTDNRVAMLR